MGKLFFYLGVLLSNLLLASSITQKTQINGKVVKIEVISEDTMDNVIQIDQNK